MTQAQRGFALGALGVLIFAMTLPMTRLAVGDTSAPQLTPAFVTSGRGAVAGLLSLLYLLYVRASWPRRDLSLIHISLIEALEAEQQQITQTLADSAVYIKDPGRVGGLQARHARIEEELLAALERWEALGSR